MRLLFTMAFAVVALSMQAQKYGYINTQELLVSLPEVVQANKTIDMLKDSLTEVAKTMVTDLQEQYKALEAKVNDISPNQLNEEKLKLQGQEQALQEFDQNSQQKIYLRSEKLLGPIQAKINAAIKTVADEGGYTYIFDTSAGNILYMDETLDISELIKAKL